MQGHSITREIGIDAGHRVTYHGSKCRNIHGHRYTVHVEVGGFLYTAGPQQGMVLDFAFLKEEMVAHIDEPCDHGLILWVEDPLLETFPSVLPHLEDFKHEVAVVGHKLTSWEGGKLYLTGFVPTAENLAMHWFHRLDSAVKFRTNGNAVVTAVKVYETPNCVAEYRPEYRQSITLSAGTKDG